MTGSSGDAPRIPRVAKGERPVNFADPAIDTLLGVVVSLLSEVSVLRDRVGTLERLLEQQGVLSRNAIDNYGWPQEDLTARAEDRAAFLDRVLRAVRAGHEDLTGGRTARPMEEIIADMAARKF